jgi:L-threonylcarbamoyladenylate synthase
MLRAGGLPRKEIEGILGIPLAALETASARVEGPAPLAPGMLASHYAPRARLRLNATDLRQGEALLGFGIQLAAGAGGAHRICNLSKRGSLIEAAANLFSHLRTLDSSGAEVIAVMPIPNEGLGEAINDRLLRAAAPR